MRLASRSPRSLTHRWLDPVLLFTAATSRDTRQVSAALFLAVAQNVITSGLLVYRLVSQHSESSRAGLHRFSRQSGTLIRMAYIISESAAMYLVVLLIYTVLFQLKHSAVIYLYVYFSCLQRLDLIFRADRSCYRR